MLETAVPAAPAPKATAPDTISVAIAQAASEWPIRPIFVSSGDSAAATAPPTKAEMMPISDHQAKAGQPTAAGAALAVGTSTTSRPTPRPSIENRSCRTSDVSTPAATADHVHETEKVETLRVAIGASKK